MSIDLSSLTASMMLGAATDEPQTIDPGDMYTSGNVVFSCPSEGEACMVTVNADGATYDPDGGMPTVDNTREAIARSKMAADLSGLTAGMMLGDEMTYTIQPGMSQDSGDVSFSCPSEGSACMVTVNADGTATYNANQDYGMPMVANTQAAIARADRAAKAAMAMAAKIAPAIADPDGDETLGENAATTNRDTTTGTENDDLDNPLRPGKTTDDGDNFTVTAGGIGTPPVISIGTDRLGMEDAGINNDDEFAEEAGAAVGGFARNVHTRTQTSGGVSTTDKVTVLDNIDESKILPYREFYDDAADELRTTAAALNADPYDRAAVDAISAAGVLALDEEDVAGNHELFSSTAFPSRDDQIYTYLNDDPSTTGVNEEERGGRTLDGMFNGVPGNFVCTTGPCTASTDSDGNLKALGGTWEFRPDAGDHFIAGGSHDEDYLAFGYWLQSTGEGDDATYKVGTFARGSMPFGGTEIAAAVSALTGTATYRGSAIGMFVMKTDIDGDGKGPIATGSGEFTANTALTARFGGMPANIPYRDQFTISGTVSDFVLTNSDDTTLDNDWSLNLQSASFATRVYDSGTGVVSAAPTAHVNTFSGSTSGMEKGTAGRWEGTFYGPTPDTNPDDTGIQYGATNYPGGVAGEFIGHFENGHAIGAFGATKR